MDYKTKFEALTADIKSNINDLCAICKHGQGNVLECDAECDKCEARCRCYSCDNGKAWEWRGVKE